eukprot:gene42353-52522_t
MTCTVGQSLLMIPAPSLCWLWPNATLIRDDLERTIRRLKDERDGDIEVAGPTLAKSLTELGLIDEYRIYLHPVARARRSVSCPMTGSTRT